jgi:hypothetical protein
MTAFLTKYKTVKILMSGFFVFYAVFSCCLMAEAALLSIEKRIAPQASAVQPSCHGQPVRETRQDPRSAGECQCGHDFSALQPAGVSFDPGILVYSNDVLDVPLVISALTANRFANSSLLVLDRRLQRDGPPVYLLNKNFRI